MKKFLALAALVLGLASCQTEPEGLDVNVGGAVDTVVTVNIPEAETRANDSGIGVFENGVLDGDATMRYIFQVYYNGETNEASRQVIYSDDTTVSFPVRLVPGRDYQFVVWADVVTAENAGDNHYNTADLKNITLSDPSTWVAMDETRDAFTASHKAEKYNGSQSINIYLYRPFAKLRVVTTDYTALANLGAGIKAAKATVKYTTEHRSAFNAYTSEAEAANKADVEHTQYTIAEYANEDDTSRTIFSDYFFAENGDIVKFEMTVYDTNGQEIVKRVFNTDINVNRNYLTTLIGPILTDANNVKIEIDDKFAIEEITLTDNLVVDLPMVIEAGTTAILNLNGFNITNKVENTETDVIVVEEGAKLTIEGEGNITAVSGNDGYAVIAEGTVIINGGTFQAGHDAAGKTNAVVYARGNGKVYVNDGTFLSDDPARYVLNKKDDDRATTTIEVRGGQFENFDPANNNAEGANTNFCAEGYGIAVRGDYYVVVPKIVADLDNVTNAITVEMTEDLNVATNTTIHTERATAEITINGNGHSIISTAKSADDFQWVGGTIPAMSTILSSANGSKVTVNDVTFEGTMSALMLGHYKDSTYKNYNTELNNVNVIDTEVVSFSAGISPAVCIYGTAVLNDCNIYGTTLSELDTDPMWPVYDVAAVNYSTTTLNNSKVGSFLFWNQAALIVNDGSVVDNLVLLGNMNNNNANNYIHINAGSEVKVIDLSKITDKKRVKITIEQGAKVGKIVANGVEYESLEAYMGPHVTTSAEFVDAFTNANGDANITLANDIVLETALEITAGKNVKLNLNGKTITVTDAAVDPVFTTQTGSTLTITGNGTVELTEPFTSLILPRGNVVIENGTFIKKIPAGTPAKDVGGLFVGIKGGTETVTIKGGYFDGGYYNADAADIDEILAGTKTLDETADDIAKRGNSNDANKVRVAVKENVQKTLNKSGNKFLIYGGTFVGVNPAWGDEGCMLPTTPNYLRPWSYYQGALLDGQEFNENGLVIPAGYEITKGATDDGRPTYTVTYNE